MENNFAETAMGEISVFLPKLRKIPIVPWSEFFSGISLPAKHEIALRISANNLHYQINYGIITSVIILFTILLRPLLLIQTLWCIGMGMYVLIVKKPLRLGPSLVLGKNEQLTVVAVVTLLLLSVTGSIVKLFWATSVGVTVCVLHAILRATSGTKKQEVFSVEELESGDSVVKGGAGRELDDSRLRRKSGFVDGL